MSRRRLCCTRYGGRLRRTQRPVFRVLAANIKNLTLILMMKMISEANKGIFRRSIQSLKSALGLSSILDVTTKRFAPTREYPTHRIERDEWGTPPLWRFRH